jgi:hypothetical protein
MQEMGSRDWSDGWKTVASAIAGQAARVRPRGCEAMPQAGIAHFPIHGAKPIYIR